ncbi:hypothetical protein FIBSPDRAFT_821724 [Athelia psychrophila]|uniref:DAGKc domain-containing protein n=1 Tax=Athelia psychrophila TaxID=1759441 RepID=A0A166NCT6_9AGAM|nr:hypothetical protein FIBSPDRAFT_821724 [Fibularhizoctonia sp. CBS 109695]
MSKLLVLCNPVCGDGKAQALLDESILPLLEKHGRKPDEVLTTVRPTHEGTAVLRFLETHGGDATIILLSGDGTLSEIINAICAAEPKGARKGAPLSALRFVLVPCGTANALYSALFPPPKDSETETDKLQSFNAFINNSETIPLTLAISELSSPPSPTRTRPKIAVSAVVASTALHAVLLHDSEALRMQIPTIERFKIAAQNNISKWYNSNVKLFPVPSVGVVQVYDPVTKAFVEHEESHLDDPIVDVEGPFAYFLSTVNVDRLEPVFRITPLQKTIPPMAASFDIVMVRPLRDPSLTMDSPEARLVFVEKATKILQGAYKDGSHVDMQYSEKGEIVMEGVGPAVVEYIRCGGWEWIPDDTDEPAHLLCADGAIFRIEVGGRVMCKAATPNDNAGFHVYV